jgi:predicted naringenin-chalcone synthase
MVRYEREAPPLAAQAARIALASAGHAPGEVTHLVTVSCTGFSAPNFDLGLVRELGLAWTVARTHLGFMGCHGALNGLRVAGGYAASDPDACVLVCAVELCSLHYQYGWNSDLAVSNGIFADGAAALVGGTAPGSSGDDWVLASSGCSLLEDSAELMAWRIGNHGFEIALSARVPGVIESALTPWLDGWLASQQLTRSDISTWAIHPGGPRILESVAAATGLRREDYAVSQEVLGEFGNMSSPTILFILDRLRQRRAPRPCLALGFGPGLAVEAALFR